MKISKPIIIIGTGRSGTSIVTDIIMRHKDLAFPSLYNDLFYKYPSINILRNIFDNPLWRIFGEKKQLNKVKFLNKFIFRHMETYNLWEYLSGFNINFSRDYLLNSTASDKRVEFIHLYFIKMLKYQNRKRLAFKLTGAPKIGYLLSIFPDAKFVIMKRKVIPTISSFLRVDFWKEKGYNEIWANGAYSEQELIIADNLKNTPELLTALQIKKINEVTQIECKKHSPDFIEVQYENFTNNPFGELKRIFAFLRLDIDNTCFNYLSNKKIYNRNKPDNQYFSPSQIKNIKKIFDN